MGKLKGGKRRSDRGGAAGGSGPPVYPGSRAKGNTGVQQAHALISDVASARTRLASRGRSAAGSRAGGDGKLVRGRSDIQRASLIDKKKKAVAIPADATIIGSGGKKLGA